MIVEHWLFLNCDMGKKNKKQSGRARVVKKKPSGFGNSINSVKEFLANRSSGLKFLSAFVLLMVLFYIFYYSSFYINYINDNIVGMQAKIGSVLLNLMGQHTSANGAQISGDAFSMTVSGGCDGMEVMALLIAGIIATPLAWQYKWKGILIGGAVLAALNILRLPALYLAGGYVSMDLFDFLHVQGGFVIFVFITVLIMLKWMSWANGQEGKVENPANG